MGRYKGKREAPLPGKAAQPQRMAGGETGSPFTVEDDPFAERQKPPVKSFFREKKKLLIVLASVLLVLGLGVSALRSWIKPPELPVEQDHSNTQQTGQQSGGNHTPGQEEASGPTDDELYPDDGYGGDVPSLSGERKEGVYTFLLVGTDKDDGNTDTIMVVAYDTVNQDINVMSIPRDTMINESWDIKKINSVYSRTGYSINSLASRVRRLIGFQPDYYVKVELSMFVELVDLIGGVEFDVPQDMEYSDPYQDLYINLKKGVQVLDGEKAMQLVRFRRYADGDITRVQVQQDFMKALIKQCLSLEHWGKIKAYIDLGLQNVETDLEFGSVVWFAANVLGLNSGVPALNVENDVQTFTLPGNYWASTWSRDTNQEQSYVTIYPNQTVDLVNKYFNPYVQKVSTGMMDVMSILENGDIASSTGNLKDTTHNEVMAVRRGEAYYDESGALVYGQPPLEPEVDEFGNYYILDEDGNVVYTDENGVPLNGGGSNGEDGAGPETDPPSTDPADPAGSTGEGGGAAGEGAPEPSETDRGEPPATEPELPAEPDEGTGESEEPAPPAVGEEETGGEDETSVDDEPPGWL